MSPRADRSFSSCASTNLSLPGRSERSPDPGARNTYELRSIGAAPENPTFAAERLTASAVSFNLPDWPTDRRVNRLALGPNAIVGSAQELNESHVCETVAVSSILQTYWRLVLDGE